MTKKPLMPTPPRFGLRMIGPGLVLIAMGLGSGEYVLWPYMVSQFGLGILWGALVGITLQYFVSNETGRYTLATGDSVFFGFQKLFRLFPYWFIISTFFSFAWPGIIGTSGELLSKLLGLSDSRIVTIIMLITIGLIMTLGGKVYATLERIQKGYMLITLPILIIIALLLITPDTLLTLAKGLAGIGNGYLLFPAGIALGEFLGAIAYAGAGGNLILSHSFYIQDEGHGMARYVDSQLEVGKNQSLSKAHAIFDQSPENIRRFRSWFRAVALEQFTTFWIIGLSTICLLAIIAYRLVYPTPQASGLAFIYLEAEKLSQLFGPIFGVFMILIGVLFLFTTQLGVFESTSRIMAENTQLLSRFFGRQQRSRVFFMFLWLQITFSIIITALKVAAPLEILFLNTFFSAVSMFVLSGALWWLNNSRLLPPAIRPSRLRNLLLLVSFIFFGLFSLIAVIEF